MSRNAIFGLFLLTTLMTGCRRKETGETEPEFAYPTEASFCEALAASECNSSVVEACYGSDSSTLEADRKECQSARKAQCNPDNLPYHADKAEDCVEARKVALLDAVWTRDELQDVFTKCLPVLSKEESDGKVCSSDHDCDAAAGLRCIVKLGNIEGVCGKPVVVGGGEVCSDSTTVCDTAYYCKAGENCVVKPVEKQACSTAAPCASDFYCSSAEDGVCTRKAKNGASCTSNELCAGGFCVGAEEGKSGVCSATLPITLTSTTCDVYRD